MLKNIVRRIWHNKIISMKKRVFKFSLDEIGVHKISNEIEVSKNMGTVVKLNKFYENFYFKFEISEIATLVLNSFLLEIMGNKELNIILKDNYKNEISLRKEYENKIKNGLTKREFSINDVSFEIFYIFLEAVQNLKKSKVIFTAQRRAVNENDLENIDKIFGNKIKDKILKVYVSSEYLDEIVSSNRDSFLTDKTLFSKFNENISIEKIEKELIKVLKEDLKEDLKEIEETRNNKLNKYFQNSINLSDKFIYDRFKEDILANIIGNEQDKSIEKIFDEKRREIRRETEAQIKNINFENENYKEKVKEIKDKIDTSLHVALVDYVIQRKAILELYSKILKGQEKYTEKKTGIKKEYTYELEKEVHNLIFPMKATSDEIDYNNHNLWLIDESLAFQSFISSDLELKNFIKNSVTLYATGDNSEVTLTKPEKFSSYLSENSVAAYAKDKGKINMNNTTLPATPNINIKSTSNKGMGLFASNGGVINAQKHYMKVENGSTGISSVGTNGGVDSNVDFNGGKLDYNGEGYALYAKDGGKITFTNGNLILRGKSTAMENDVIVFNIVNATAPINVSNLAGNISSLVGTGVDVSAGTEGGQTFNKYKLAALDGGTMNIDVDVNKADGPTTVSGYYFQRFLGQRLKTNVNSNVTARLTTAQADDLYKGQVVAIEANSSKNASTNAETQVNIAAGKTIDVARTDGTDKGGVGVFVNYGKVDNKGTISVEKDSTANSDGVGIYSANGSEVTNEGTIDVGGKNGIGILGIAYRTDATGSPKVNEFGGKPGEGKVTILNKGKVTLNGEGATGIFAKNNKAGSNATNATATNDAAGILTLSGNKSVGMSGEKSTLTNTGTINIQGQESTGMFAKDSSEMTNNGTINLVDSASADKPNIGMFTEDKNTVIHNNKDIIGGNNTYGIYGKTVNLGATGQIKVGDNSVGIFSNGEYAAGSTPTIDLAANSKIEVGKNEAVGVFTTGENQVIKSEGDMKIGDGSYGFVIRGKGTKLFTHNPNGVTLGNDAVFAYSADKTGNIENKTTLTSTGSKNYGLYAAGIVNNFADINFGTGVGNVGIYSIGGGTATNGTSTIRPTIRVSKSDTVNKLYGIGMAAGYTDDNGVTHQTGTITNYGTIKVEKDNGIGMYATGSGSKAINHGDIELSGKGTTGMYLDNNAIGENYGTIKTAPNTTKDGIIGVVAMNGAVIKNYGTIEIKGSGNTGIYLAKGKNEGTVPQDLDGSKGMEIKQQLPTGKKVSGIDIDAPGDGTATIKRNGRVITPTYVDTITSSANAPKVRSGATELDLRAANLNNIPSLSQASSIGMYIDTSGVNYTNPIKGLDKLTNLKRVNLIFGTEAARYTSSKDIKIGQNILSPYNKVISTLSAGGGKKFTINSASLTWITTGTQNSDDTFNAVYLSKIPYTAFAKDKDTYNFMDGLEQRYGVEGVGSREKELFNKLNAIGKGEPMLFAQAVDEMKGHQYSNIQQRVQATGIILDKEFDYLRSEWQTVTKDSNKIKTFGTRGEYKTNTAGVINYKYNAYGVAYVHENEDVKLGKGFGWYTGIVHNRLKFKDLGNSKEEQVQGKIGLYKSVPFDYNNSLNWTISGDIFVGYNRMNRRFLIVDEIFGAKSRYYNYGIEVKNEIGKEFRLSESFSLRPYAALNLEYGRTSKIREKSGEMKLEVKANDYISIRPEVGTELAYKHYFGTKALKTGLSVAYENELGRVANAKNKAKVAGTTADWYNLRGEKEDRKGNVKFDLNLGLDNQMYGVTANVGYDTKGENIRGGLGIRIIF